MEWARRTFPWTNRVWKHLPVECSYKYERNHTVFNPSSEFLLPWNRLFWIAQCDELCRLYRQLAQSVLSVKMLFCLNDSTRRYQNIERLVVYFNFVAFIFVFCLFSDFLFWSHTHKLLYSLQFLGKNVVFEFRTAFSKYIFQLLNSIEANAIITLLSLSAQAQLNLVSCILPILVKKAVK